MDAEVVVVTALALVLPRVMNVVAVQAEAVVAGLAPELLDLKNAPLLLTEPASREQPA